MSNLPAIFLLLALICLAFSLVSLITPKAAFFLKNKTRLRAFLSYLGIALLFMVGLVATAPKPEQLATKSGSAPAPAEQKASEPAPAPAAMQPAVEKKAVPATTQHRHFYRVARIRDTSFAGRRRAEILIMPTQPDADFTADSLAKTCMAAARHFAESRKLQAVQVVIDDVPFDTSFFKLAVCSHSPDKGGWSGKDGWTWKDVSAMPRGHSKTELEAKKLWHEWRGKFQKDGMTDEEALSAAIAKKLNIKPDDVTAALLFLEPKPIDAERFANVEPQGPAE